MRRQGSERGGRIINTASVSGITPFPYASAYSTTKAAVIALTKVAALEYARDKITVNAVCPGTFLSPIHERLPDAAIKAMADRHPLGLGTAAQVVSAYVYLAGPDASWTTGTSVVVDGGYSAP